MAIMHFTPREDFVVLDAVISGEVVIGPDPMAAATEKTFYVCFSEQTVGGVVEITTAPMGTPGTWAPIATVPWAKGGQTHCVSVPGIHLAIRIRITQPIVMGTVTVYAVGSV